MIMKPPCKDCPDRYPACHDHCDRYKEWKQVHEQKRAAARDQDEYEIINYEVQRSKRLKKKKG